MGSVMTQEGIFGKIKGELKTIRELADKDVLEMIRRALDEDVGAGDITTNALFPKPKTIQAVIISGCEGVLCGITIAMAAFVMRNSKIKFMPLAMDGERIRPEQQIAYIEGDAKAVLSAERTALNFLSRLSGISTLTAEFMEEIRPYKAKIMDTRKTTPGLRLLEKYAVKIGGGCNHRMGLWDQVLIKDNHINVLRSEFYVPKTPLNELIRRVRQKIKKGIKGEI